MNHEIITNELNKKIFCTSSEKVDTNQLSFFNEAEKHNDSKVNELSLEEVTYKRTKKNSVTGKKDNLANLERVVIEHKLEGEDLKSKKCGSELVEIGVKSRKEILLALPRSPLGKALDYAKKHVPSLKTVLLDERLEIGNNSAEHEIKPFVLSGNNFLFAILQKEQPLVVIYIVL